MRWTPVSRPLSVRLSIRRPAPRAAVSATSTRKAWFARNRSAASVGLSSRGTTMATRKKSKPRTKAAAKKSAKKSAKKVVKLAQKKAAVPANGLRRPSTKPWGGAGKALERLVKSCDVLVENFGPGVLERMGYTWEHVQELNPRMIVASIKGFGPGPYQDCKVYENIAQCAGGAASTTGFDDGPPLVT